MSIVLPRLLIGGTGSGCGKTTVTAALLRALRRRGLTLRAFKCGPDYIDPMFHTAALGVPSRNLDLFFEDGDGVRAQLARAAVPGAVGIIEGVMGFYDGVSGTTDTASAAHLARETGTPAVLVVRPRGQSLTLAAILQGLRDFAPNTLAGVILNGVSPAMAGFYRDLLAPTGLTVYGCLPPVEGADLPERHLGLVTAEELPDLHARLDRLADAAEAGLDLDGLLALAGTATALPDPPALPGRVTETPVRIAVARDAAFCFYYADNIDRLQTLGAELVPFSPMADDRLPENIGGLYLGGGYPEVHARALTAWEGLRREIAQRIREGLPTIAECGGFLYLHEALETAEGVFPMCGVVPGRARMEKKLGRFGYVTLTAQRDNLLCQAGEQLRAHEFHYARAADDGDAFEARKPNGRHWPCGVTGETLYAGFPHLYFGAAPQCAARFVQRCAACQEGKR